MINFMKFLTNKNFKDMKVKLLFLMLISIFSVQGSELYYLNVETSRSNEFRFYSNSNENFSSEDFERFLSEENDFAGKDNSLGAFPVIGIVGTLTGWADGADILMTTLNGVNYLATNVTFLADGEMKFRRDGVWVENWGDNQFPSGIGTQGGQNIPVPFGTYDITFNFETGAYSFTLLPSMFPVIGIIGEFNGWSESVNMPT